MHQLLGDDVFIYFKWHIIMSTGYETMFFNAKCMEFFRLIKLFVERTQLNCSCNIMKVRKSIL